MTFLALSTAQVLVLVFLTAAAVVAFFFLRLRHRRVVVGSSLLWQRVLDERQAVSLMERLRRWISLAVALLIALLIAVALGRPYSSEFGGPPRPMVIVMDSSPSMRTRTTDGGTRWSRATDQARELLNRTSPVGRYMVTDTSGRIQTLLTDDRLEASRALDWMGPSGGDHRFPEIPVSDADVYFITDGVDAIRPPASVTTLSIFEAADNVGIAAFEVQVDPTSPSGYVAYLEVTNYSSEAKDVAILLSGVGERRVGHNVRLEPAESWKETLDLAEFQGGGLRLRVQAEQDALALDDTAFGYLPARSETRVTLVTASSNSYLETLLRLSPRVELAVVTPDLFQEDATTDVYVFERFVPQSKPGAPSLVFSEAGTAWLPTATGTVNEARVTAWDAEHPIMRLVPVHDLEIDRAARVETAGWKVLAASPETALIAIEEGRTQTVFVGFDLADSDFPLQLGFPIFIENVLAWFAGDTLARSHGLGPIELPGETDTVTDLDGQAVPTETLYGNTVIDASEPELYTAVSNGRRSRIAANLTDPRYSDINRGAGSASENREGSLVPAGTELWSHMLLIALLLGAVEWWTYHRRITV